VILVAVACASGPAVIPLEAERPPKPTKRVLYVVTNVDTERVKTDGLVAIPVACGGDCAEMSAKADRIQLAGGDYLPLTKRVHCASSDETLGRAVAQGKSGDLAGWPDFPLREAWPIPGVPTERKRIEEIAGVGAAIEGFTVLIAGADRRIYTVRADDGKYDSPYEEADWSGVLLAAGKDLVTIAENAVMTYKVVGTVDVDGDGGEEIVLEVEGPESGYITVVRLSGEGAEEIGTHQLGWECL
jgi:hypothetical protein